MKTALALLVSATLAAQSTMLQIRVPGGEGAAHAAGSRTPGITVQVTDQAGEPVAGVIVSLRLPDDGPSGAFANGLSSEIVTTGPDGRATTSPIRWARVPGLCDIRITAAKERLRAGTVISQRITELTASVTFVTPAARAGRKLNRKWVVIGLAAAAGAGVALSVGLAGGSRASNSATSLQIGPPQITITHP